MKTAILILILAVSAYLLHLSHIAHLTSHHQRELSAHQSAHEIQLDRIESDYEAARAEAEACKEELEKLASYSDTLAAEAAQAAVTIRSLQSELTQLRDQPARVRPELPVPGQPAPVVLPDPDHTTAARAALEFRLVEAQRTLTQWKRAAADEENQWANSRLRQSDTDRQKRRDQVAAAIAAKQAEVDAIKHQLSTLR